MWQSHPKYVQEIDAYVLLTFGWLFPFFPHFVQLFALKVEKQPNKPTDKERWQPANYVQEKRSYNVSPIDVTSSLSSMKLDKSGLFFLNLGNLGKVALWGRGNSLSQWFMWYPFPISRSVIPFRDGDYNRWSIDLSSETPRGLCYASSFLTQDFLLTRTRPGGWANEA